MREGHRLRGPVFLIHQGGQGQIKLTRRQVETLVVIDQLTRECGYPPSGSEIAEVMKISTQGLFDQLRALKSKSLVTSTYGVHRSLRLTPDGLAVLKAALDQTPRAENEDTEKAQVQAQDQGQATRQVQAG